MQEANGEIEVKEIPVSQGNVAYVDECDFETISAHRWYVLAPKKSLTKYARTTIGKKTVYMHRLIMGNPVMGEIDHIDGNALNNTRENLRLVTHRVNVMQGRARRAYDAWKATQA